MNHDLHFDPITPASIPNQGRIQDFQIEGAQKIMCRQRTSQARSPLRPGSRARLRALEALGF